MNNTSTIIYTGQPIRDIPRDVTHVILDDNVAVIEAWAFNFRSKLANVQLGHQLITIGDRAFLGCRALESITISSNVKGVCPSAISFCEKLETVDLNEGSKNIGGHAFECCTSR